MGKTNIGCKHHEIHGWITRNPTTPRMEALHSRPTHNPKKWHWLRHANALTNLRPLRNNTTVSTGNHRQWLQQQQRRPNVPFLKHKPLDISTCDEHNNCYNARLWNGSLRKRLQQQTANSSNMNAIVNGVCNGWLFTLVIFIIFPHFVQLQSGICPWL